MSPRQVLLRAREKTPGRVTGLHESADPEALDPMSVGKELAAFHSTVALGSARRRSRAHLSCRLGCEPMLAEQPRKFVLAEELRCDDGSGPTPNPTCRRGAGDSQLGEENRVTLLAHEVTQTMVVGSAAGAVHRPEMR